jgi:hypothetical protein
MRMYPSYTFIYLYIPSYDGICRDMSGYQGVRIPDVEILSQSPACHCQDPAEPGPTLHGLSLVGQRLGLDRVSLMLYQAAHCTRGKVPEPENQGQVRK